MEKNGLFSQRIRLRHLHTFVAVAQQGTLGRAAETLNLSQPALSKTLNELEQLTGTRLFERGRLGAQLTLVGEQFLTHAVKVLDALNTAGQALNRKEGMNSDVVRIGALPTAALGILPTVIGQFHKQQKDITLQVATMNNTMLLAGLKSGDVDIGIGRMSDPELMSGLNYELLFLESLKLVVRPGHPLLQETVTLSRVMEGRWWSHRKGQSRGRMRKRYCKARVVKFPPAVLKRCRPRFHASSPSITTMSGSSLPAR
ncbi:LysR family transcriptional regulator [Klebsiella aerogenes]|nr:LysR family transcriptional regulator [Klebsiella aerogenes]